MRRLSPFLVAVLLAGAALAGLCPTVRADVVSATQARLAVEGWLLIDGDPLGVSLGDTVARVQSFEDIDGDILYFVVYLDPSGFVVVSADDRIEPVIAFSVGSKYDPSLLGPLGALVSKDLAGRIEIVGDGSRKPSPGVVSSIRDAGERWQLFMSLGASGKPSLKVDSVEDERVASFIESQWGQALVDGTACFNYYTPPGAPGTVANYPVGCIATAMAQIMRYFEYPTAGVAALAFDVTVDSVVETRTLRGGDGVGGAYSWDDMPLVPDSAITDGQRKAIGSLCHDSSVSVGSIFSSDLTAATCADCADAFVSAFGYSNAVAGQNNGLDIGDGLNDMVNCNLDLGLPVVLGISSASSDIGHAVVADGYGYSSSVLYHHLNLGWDGMDDAWYGLPNLETDIGSFTSVDSVVYNIFTTGTGEIVSGRVTDSVGNGVSGVTITTVGGGATVTATTGSTGVYAIANVVSGTSYTVSAAKTGYYFADQAVTTGTSADGSHVSGNKWGVDFVNEPSLGLVVPQISQFQVGAGDGYIDVEWLYPSPSEAYEGIIVAYGTSLFPTLETVEDGDGNTTLSVKDGTELYAGKTDIEATVTLTNGTTAFFTVWAYRGTEYGKANYVSSTPAPGADGINDTETLHGPTPAGRSSGGCFISVCLAADEDAGTREANRKRLHEARDRFLELRRKAKKPKEGDGRIVGFVVDASTYLGIPGAEVKGTVVPEDENEELAEKETSSAKTGVYELEGLDPGKYSVEAMAEEYEPFTRENVFVKPGIGPGLGTWLVVELSKTVTRKGGVVGTVKSIEATFKKVVITVVEASEEWKDLEGSDLELFADSKGSVVVSLKDLLAGDAVECHFSKRGTKYIIIDIVKEEVE